MSHSLLLLLYHAITIKIANSIVGPYRPPIMLLKTPPKPPPPAAVDDDDDEDEELDVILVRVDDEVVELDKTELVLLTVLVVELMV